MPSRFASRLRRMKSALRTHLMGPQALAFLPALMLAAYWMGGQTALLLMALIVPALFALGGLFGRDPGGRGVDGLTGLRLRPAIVAALDDGLAGIGRSGRAVGAMAAALDNFDDTAKDLDDAGKDRLLLVAADRIGGILRDSDVLARLDGARFVIALPDMRRADHDTMLRIAQRMQEAVAEPVSVEGQRVFATLSVGFCLPGKLHRATGAAMVDAAEAALATARAQGGNAVRGFDPTMRPAEPVDLGGVQELTEAFEQGQLHPWFQPQVAAETGEVLGFEALARWTHPERGLVMPADFLPLIEPAGLSRRLGEVMLYGALQALRSWDSMGLDVATVAVNFSHGELVGADFADRVRWELDRFDIAPERLAVEVLETAVAQDTETVARNLRALSALGCSIDLDDFGTGNTSIASIKRFAVRRLKIDRSFVTRIDRDKEQRDMVAAILTMARRLELSTVAEGVETVGEQATLAAMGCDAVQGFHIARPMPAEATGPWIETHRRKLGLLAQRGGAGAKAPKGTRRKTA